MGLFRRTKNNDKLVVRQIIDLVPRSIFNRCVDQHQSDNGCSKYKTYDHFVALSFGQLNKSYTLGDISANIGVCEKIIEDLGLKQSPAKSTMSDGNKKRSYKVFETLYHRLLSYYGNILIKQHKSHIIHEIKGRTVKLIDSTTVSLCLAMFDWAKFRTAKGGLKIHTSFDCDLMLPDIINITPAKKHDRYGLAQLVFPKSTIIVEDRGYFDFGLIKSRVAAENIFVTRIKSNTIYSSIYEIDTPDLKDQDILRDELIYLDSKAAQTAGIDKIPFRLVHVYKEDENKVIEIITNELQWEARTIADLYKKRWDIELFFKSLKQNLQIKTFLGTSENAVKSQIYIALINYMLLELIRRTINSQNDAFSTLVEKIRTCLYFYLSLDYVCNQINQKSKKVSNKSTEINFKVDLFSG
ncbi:MAG: IS4 family transposase [Flavobacteriaceae bacterium]